MLFVYLITDMARKTKKGTRLFKIGLIPPRELTYLNLRPTVRFNPVVLRLKLEICVDAD